MLQCCMQAAAPSGIVHVMFCHPLTYTPTSAAAVQPHLGSPPPHTCSDGQVYGSSNPLDPTKVRMSIKESSDKLMEGINFLLRGLRLLGSDVGNAGGLRGPGAGAGLGFGSPGT
jgi:hypothetical protein